MRKHSRQQTRLCNPLLTTSSWHSSCPNRASLCTATLSDAPSVDDAADGAAVVMSSTDSQLPAPSSPSSWLLLLLARGCIASRRDEDFRRRSPHPAVAAVDSPDPSSGGGGGSASPPGVASSRTWHQGGACVNTVSRSRACHSRRIRGSPATVSVASGQCAMTTASAVSRASAAAAGVSASMGSGAVAHETGRAMPPSRPAAHSISFRPSSATHERTVQEMAPSEEGLAMFASTSAQGAEINRPVLALLRLELTAAK